MISVQFLPWRHALSEASNSQNKTRDRQVQLVDATFDGEQRKRGEGIDSSHLKRENTSSTATAHMHSERDSLGVSGDKTLRSPRAASKNNSAKKKHITHCAQWIYVYRVFRLLVHLGWVDFDLGAIP